MPCLDLDLDLLGEAKHEMTALAERIVYVSIQACEVLAPAKNYVRNRFRPLTVPCIYAGRKPGPALHPARRLAGLLTRRWML
jgi:hypothetical protein